MSSSFVWPFFSALILLISSLFHFTAPLERLLRYLTSPIITPFTIVRSTANNQIQSLISLPQIEKENEFLENENNNLKVKVKVLSEVVKDQKVLDTLAHPTWKTQGLRLVSFNNLALMTSQNINEISVGQPVISGNKLVGLIKAIKPPLVEVLPLTHPEIRLNVQTEAGIRGQYLYKNNLPTITNLPSQTPFNSHETIFSLPDDKIPENLIIGTLEQIITNPTSPNQEATIKLSDTLLTNSNLLVITKP